jgi:hypothetical protein
LNWWGLKKPTGGGVKSKSNPLVLQIGSIVIAPITPDGGVIKPRPAVIINDPPSDLLAPIDVIGITTDDEQYDPNDQVRYHPKLYKAMPFNPDGSHQSKLTSPCAAKANWYEKFPRNKLRHLGGLLPANELDELLEWFDAGDEEEIARLEADRIRRFFRH